MTKKTQKTHLALLVLWTVLPLAAVAQGPAGPPPLPPGPGMSDLDMANRLNQAGLKQTDYLATLELSLRNSGDLWSIMKKTAPQGLFVTVEHDGALIKDIAKSKKPKVAEAVGPGVLNIKARYTRPGKRYEERCYGELSVGFQQVVFLPYGGEDGYFSCQVLPRLLPDEVFAEWKKGIAAEKTQSYSDCASVHPRGSGGFWTCIDAAGIVLPDVPVG